MKQKKIFAGALSAALILSQGNLLIENGCLVLVALGGGVIADAGRAVGGEGTGQVQDLAANMQTKLYSVTVSINEDVSGLLSGMFADVSFRTDTSADAVVIHHHGGRGLHIRQEGHLQLCGKHHTKDGDHNHRHQSSDLVLDTEFCDIPHRTQPSPMWMLRAM